MKPYLKCFFIILIFSISVLTNLTGGMNIIDFEPELWPRLFCAEPVRENTNGELLAAWYLRNDPLAIDYDLDYICTRWGKLVSARGPYPNAANITSNGFSVCIHIRYKEIIPSLKKMGVNVLFTPHATNESRNDGFKIVPMPLPPLQLINPAEEKDVFCSFIGTARTHPIRTQLKKVLTQPEFHIELLDGRWFLKMENLKKKEIYSRKYCDIMSRSRFALCPRGTGPNSLRFWEALRAGAIPVLISDGLALPDSFDWDSCSIRIAEDMIHTIPEVLHSIPPEVENSLREQCLVAAKKFSGKNYISVIRDYFE